MATQAQFSSTPRADCVAIATANANRDGTGTIGTVITAGASGTRIERVNIKATVTTTAGMVRLYIHNGTSYFLFKEVLVSAIVPSATVAAFESSVTFGTVTPLWLPSGYSLRASTEKAENFNITAIGGDL